MAFEVPCTSCLASDNPGWKAEGRTRVILPDNQLLQLSRIAISLLAEPLQMCTTKAKTHQILFRIPDHKTGRQSKRKKEKKPRFEGWRTWLESQISYLLGDLQLVIIWPQEGPDSNSTSDIG